MAPSSLVLLSRLLWHSESRAIWRRAAGYHCPLFGIPCSLVVTMWRLFSQPSALAPHRSGGCGSRRYCSRHRRHNRMCPIHLRNRARWLAFIVVGLLAGFWSRDMHTSACESDLTQTEPGQSRPTGSWRGDHEGGRATGRADPSRLRSGGSSSALRHRKRGICAGGIGIDGRESSGSGRHHPERMPSS